MEKERLEAVLSNILGELYEKTFDCNSNEFLNYLRLEIGLTGTEIYSLICSGSFPNEAGDYFINILNNSLNYTENCLSSEESKDS